MWVLGRYLPIMVGSHVPDDDVHWCNFLLLLKMAKYIFAPNITIDEVASLDILITEHHRDFITLYPDISVIPKMHFLLHVPRLILE